jgi:E3 ubiquitin-protein ligase TRIP12
VQVRAKALQVIVKLVHFMPADMLRGLLQNVAISSFIAGLLTSTNGVTVAAAVLLAELLLCKLPVEYRR